MNSEAYVPALWSRFGNFARFNPCFLLAAAVGFGLAAFWSEVRPPLDFRTDRIVELEGWISGSPQSLEGFAYLELRVERAVQTGRPVRIPGRLAVFVYSSAQKEEGVPGLEYGDRVRLRCFLDEPSHFALPGVADFRDIQWRRGISATARLKSLDQIERLPFPAGCPVLRPLLAYGQEFRRHCRQAFDEIQRKLILSAFLGDKRELDEFDREQIRRLGAFHLFVVSGFHISLALGLLHLLLARFGLAGRLTALAGMWSYALLAGATPSALRAGLMTTLLYVFLLAGLGKSFLNFLGLTALALMAWRPALVFDPGFQFSFLSLAAIGLLALPWGGWIFSLKRGIAGVWSDAVWVARDQDSRRSRRIRFFLEEKAHFLPRRTARLVLGKSGGLAAYALGLLVCNFYIQLFTLPLSLHYSNRFVWTQAASNLVLVPLFSGFVPVCLLLFLLFKSPLAWPVERLAALYADGISGAMSALESVSETVWVRHPGAMETGLLLILFPILHGVLRGKARAAALLLPFLTLALARQPAGHPAGWLQVTLLDVGQGEAIHLRYPNGEDAMVDTGGLRSPDGAPSLFVGERLVGRYLWQERTRGLDFVLLTHPHVDHIQGFDFLRRVFPLAALHFRDFQEDYRPAPLVPLSRGDLLVIGGVQHRVLHPAESERFWSVNDASLVLLLRYGSFSMLLTGDIERRAERALLPDLGPVTVLKTPHHGGASSSSEEFLERLRPRAVVISAGRRNVFGHPSPRTLQRLIGIDAPVFTTAMLGTIRIETDGRRWRLLHYGGGSGRFQLVLEQACPSSAAASVHESMAADASPRPGR